MPVQGLAASITTKELLKITGISEATLRRWLKDGKPVPELSRCKRDWRGWHIWEQRHVEAIRRYQDQKQRQHEVGDGSERALTAFAVAGRQRTQRSKRQ